MATEIIMPQGGQDIKIGRVVRWLKKEGDLVSAEEIICEVETEKAVFEVAAPENGVILQIIVPEGEETKIFSVIGLIGQPGEKVGFDEVNQKSKAVGEEKPLTASQNGFHGNRISDGAEFKVSPKAKKLAKEKGINLRLIKGTGPNGRITSQDVLQVEDDQQANGTARGRTHEECQIVPMTKVGKVTARKMQQSNSTIPHFYVSVDVDMTTANTFRQDLDSDDGHQKSKELTITDMIVRACTIALKKYPQLNSSVKDDETIIIWDDINIGIATAIESGLVVPVIEKAGELSLNEITNESRRINSLARVGKQASLVPARFTVSNLGMFNVDNFIAIINPPEAAILAVSSIKKKVIAIGDSEIGIRDIMKMTLSVDHRITDGLVATQFINEIKSLLEQPDLLM